MGAKMATMLSTVSLTCYRDIFHPTLPDSFVVIEMKLESECRMFSRQFEIECCGYEDALSLYWLNLNVSTFTNRIHQMAKLQALLMRVAIATMKVCILYCIVVSFY